MLQRLRNLLGYKGMSAKVNAVVFWFQNKITGKYYSQHGQDKLVTKKLFPGKTDGTFVDIGANDGVTFSNTFLLEKAGWKGVAIEPIPAVFDALATNRNCETVNACIAPNSGKQTFRVIRGYAQMLSGLVDEYDTQHVERIDGALDEFGGEFEDIQIDCFNFNELMEKHGIFQIDYLSIDVEGAELAILESIDYDRIQISVISAENNYSDQRIDTLLTNRGFELYSRVGKDDFYRAAKLHSFP